jgi:hypothetical protein
MILLISGVAGGFIILLIVIFSLQRKRNE